MKLWLISQSFNKGYDTYDSAVVAAETEEDARKLHPNKGHFWDGEGWCYKIFNGRVVPSCHPDWADPQHVQVEYLGETDRDIRGAILASFNAGWEN